VHGGVAVLVAESDGDALLGPIARGDAHTADLLGDGLYVRFFELDVTPETHTAIRNARVPGEQHDDVQRLIAEILHYSVLHAGDPRLTTR
jgi:hypothetical protein